MRPGVNREVEFSGIQLQTPRSNLPPGFFQEDVGGDHFKRGSWKRRRGMRRMCVQQRASAITTILGFELGGPGFAYLNAEGTNVYGGTDLVIQP